MMEEHPEVGHLIFAALALIQKLQPAAIVLENVEDYRVSASAQILRSQLRDMGYQVREHVLRARDFGSLENRVRWALVATTDGLPTVESVAHSGQVQVATLGQLLDDVDTEAACWSSMDYRHVKALTDRLVADALAALESGTPTPSTSMLTQQHALIRSAEEYGDLFAHVATATQSSESTQP